MKKLLTIVAAASVLSAPNVIAEDYKVTVKLNRNTTSLTFRETKPMTFPELTMDEGTLEGAICTSGSNTLGKNSQLANNVNSLCANLNGQAASFEFKGTANTAIVYTAKAPVQTKRGLKFSGNIYENHAQNLNAQGLLSVSIIATIELVDKDVVTPGDYEFNYEVTAAYQ